ncbi:hypothetical protein BH10PSE19_BH10PSE19_20900 [soil metagenome]
MILFWSIIGLMTLLSLIFVLLPLCLSPNSYKTRWNDTNLTLYQQKMRDLKNEYQNGLLTETHYQQAQQELEQGLLTDYPDILLTDQTNITQKLNPSLPLNKKNFWTAGFLVLALPALAVTLYLKWGFSNDLAQWYAEQQQATAVQKTMAEFKSPAELITKMQTILKQRPDSTRGWFLLGRLYFSLGKYSEAAHAFAKAHTLEAKDPAIALQYAQALFFTGQPQSKRKAVLIAKQILAIDKTSDAAINLLALDAYQKGRYQAAIDYWEQLLSRYNSESNEAKTLLEAIAKAQSKLK